MINGIPTVLTALVVPFVLPKSPETAEFLSLEDRQTLMRASRRLDRPKMRSSCGKEVVIAGVKDWKTYAFTIGQITGLIVQLQCLPAYHH